MNGNELYSTVLTIDTAYQFIDSASQLLIFLDIFTRRNGKLHKHDLSDPFRMLTKEYFHSMHLLRNTLNVIKTINTDNDLTVAKSVLQLLDTVLNFCPPSRRL